MLFSYWSGTLPHRQEKNQPFKMLQNAIPIIYELKRFSNHHYYETYSDLMAFKFVFKVVCKKQIEMMIFAF